MGITFKSVGRRRTGALLVAGAAVTSLALSACGSNSNGASADGGEYGNLIGV